MKKLSVFLSIIILTALLLCSITSCNNKGKNYPQVTSAQAMTVSSTISNVVKTYMDRDPDEFTCGGQILIKDTSASIKLYGTEYSVSGIEGTLKFDEKLNLLDDDFMPEKITASGKLSGPSFSGKGQKTSDLKITLTPYYNRNYGYTDISPELEINGKKYNEKDLNYYGPDYIVDEIGIDFDDLQYYDAEDILGALQKAQITIQYDNLSFQLSGRNFNRQKAIVNGSINGSLSVLFEGGSKEKITVNANLDTYVKLQFGSDYFDETVNIKMSKTIDDIEGWAYSMEELVYDMKTESPSLPRAPASTENRLTRIPWKQY